MRKPVVAGNWKMNGTRASVQSLVQAIKAGLPEQRAAEVALCSPFPYLTQVKEALKGSSMLLGAQTMSEFQAGAYTGEVSGEMLLESGATHVILGHSERRALYAESSQIVANKFERALAVGLIPILCVGETLTERQQGATLQVVGEQLAAVLDKVGVAGFSNAVLAYEPVWAIGTGLTATPDQAQEVHAALRGMIANHNNEIAIKLRILYGGSVKAGNAASLFGCPDIDGGLIGGASLDASEFLAICQAAE